MKTDNSSNQTNNKVQKVIVILTIIILLFAGGVIIVVREMNHYVDTHTWATVRVTGEMHSDTDDAVYEEHEYLKGDYISFADVSLMITNITNDGDVSFSVQRGHLYNTQKQEIKSDTLHRAVNTAYATDTGSISLQVTNNRYQ